jgi:DNA-binding transcriptional MerR regulator
MYTISEVGKFTDLTSRTLRHYEEVGLIVPSRRGSNGYRYYAEDVLTKVLEIKKYKSMDFSLEEISSFLNFKGSELEGILNSKLNAKLESIEEEIQRLTKSKNEVEVKLSATKNFFKGKPLELNQRRIFVETIKSEVLDQLKKKRPVSHEDLKYLKREDVLFDTAEKREFFDVLKKCLKFAHDEGIKLGPTRGTAAASLSLYALGWSEFDPSNFNLNPERFLTSSLNLHIDVEFKNGKKFIDYCRSVTANLKIGKIEAFKLPIIDIIENVHKRIGDIDYNSIDNNDPLILDQFRKGDIDRIFSFCIPGNTLVAKHFDSRYYRDGSANKMMSDYLKSQEIYNFQDLLNIEAIFRPDNLDVKPFMREYMDRYPRAKKERFYYDCLSASINEYLTPNFGVIIYQEDLEYIIHEYTSWSFEKCNLFRKTLTSGKITEDQKNDFRQFANDEVLDLLIKESSVTFCKSHSLGAWPSLIKKSAVLKALHKDIYFDEIQKWEKENGYSWGDFGFIQGGISILQQ